MLKTFHLWEVKGRASTLIKPLPEEYKESSDHTQGNSPRERILETRELGGNILKI